MLPHTRANRLQRHVRALLFDVNVPLIAGALLTLAILAALLGAALLTSQDPLQMRINEPNAARPQFPAPPGTPGFPLGTDVQGRDMLARLLYGGRYTIAMCLLATLARVVIGALVGMQAAWYTGSQRLVNSVIAAWSAIPPLFFALFARQLLALAVFGLPRAGHKSLDVVLKDAVVFTIIMGVTGWPEIAVRCQAAVASLREQPFVEAAYTLGLRRGAVLWRHILPNLRGLLLADAANAMAGALLLLAELGFLQVFIGGGTEDITGSPYLTPLYSEWGSLVATSLRQRNQGYWILIEPLLAFTLAIVAFNLLAEGLRRRR
ncbi:MAG TPA: ABC transporter permease subunit [Kouleothrix sp.]|uniref:ABC transporter permease n=1 Tax=Kouleothrix sp. TaxID=2779161 RepID=UPI002C772385|nr:ABC transporter permease subunit [Kouleothrix sp.]HRC77409.1 ABC transporter permease subunit [Kouleothrix sp.]